MLTFPVLVVLMIPLVVGESFLIAFFIKTPAKKVWVKVTAANIVSTIFGVPLTWLVLVFIQMWTGGGRGQEFDSLTHKLLAGTLHTAWLADGTDPEPSWAFPAVFAFQFFAYGIASILIEYAVLWLMWRKDPKPNLFKAVVVTNAASYLIIMAIPLLLVTGGILYG